MLQPQTMYPAHKNSMRARLDLAFQSKVGEMGAIYFEETYYCEPQSKSMHCNAVEFFLLTFPQTPDQIANIIHEAYSSDCHYARASKPCHEHCPAIILKSTHYSPVYMWRMTIPVLLHEKSGRTLTTDTVYRVSHTIIHFHWIT